MRVIGLVILGASLVLALRAVETQQPAANSATR
jgi:hypothetical protein